MEFGKSLTKQANLFPTSNASNRSGTRNFGIPEYVGFSGAEMSSVFNHYLSYKDSLLLVSDTPRLGVESTKKKRKKILKRDLTYQ